MGMDLIGAGLSYNWSGWRRLIWLLEGWGVDTRELNHDSNDGDPICKETCTAIADAIETHLDELSALDREWLEPAVAVWRGCVHCEQW